MIRVWHAGLIWIAWIGALHAENMTATAPKALFQTLRNPATSSESAEDDRIDPDRPHFPEASTTVGLGRAVLESGYTFAQKNGVSLSRSYPEGLLRVGAFADWFELRVGQNLTSEERKIGGSTERTGGLQDTYLGAKIALTQQNGLIPSAALIPQMTIPTGSSDQTARRLLVGLNADFGWEIVKERFGVELLLANNQIKDELGGIQHQFATGLTGVFQMNKQLEFFIEWDAYSLSGGLASTSPQHYAVGGLVYFATPDFALDARVGTGLNHRSSDLIAGVGFSVRH